ncbi:putative pyridoxal-phosphate dependent enzyme [Pseudomonas aeruginosa]|nr:putative pyridoxal-phosphate dependent enzyme [Pseudomonas aeruginosa]
MSSLPLYFDYAATTPVDERVIRAMVECLGYQACFGNPASNSHAYGRQARRAVERAREQVAALVGASAGQIVWTSGATESNNLALKGVAQALDAPGHLITSRLEHKAVLDTVQQLADDGWSVTWLAPGTDGLIRPEQVEAAWRADTRLVSLMRVNNELGTLTDIAAIGERVRERGALFHVDAAQASGKVAIDLGRLAVDLMSFSAHKTYGPKGIGALYVGPRAERRLKAQIHGGGHEQGLRSGTLATHQIVGMGEAFALAGELFEEEGRRIAGTPAASAGGAGADRRLAPERQRRRTHRAYPEPDLRQPGLCPPGTGVQPGGVQHLGLQLGAAGAVPRASRPRPTMPPALAAACA